ncbi:MAG: ABC transporter permease subunit [Desulfurococcaceae archaeon]
MNINGLNLALSLSIVFIFLFLITPVIYVFGYLLPHISECARYFYVKLPPDGEVFRIYETRDGPLISFTGLDFGPFLNSIFLSISSASVIVLAALLSSLTCLGLRGFPRLLMGYLIPFIAALPMPLLSGYAVLHLFHRDFGLLNNLVIKPLFGFKIAFEGIIGVFIYQVLNFYPIAHLILFTYMDSIDRVLIETALSLGDGGWGIIRKIILPLSKPAITATYSLIMILSLEDLGGPIVFSRYNSARNVLSYLAYYDFISEYGYTISLRSLAYVLTMCCIALLVFAFSWKSIKRSLYPIVSPSKVYIEYGGFTKAMMLFSTTLFHLLSLIIVLMIFGYSITNNWFGNLLPSRITMENYLGVLTNPYYSRAFLNTVIYSAVSVLLILVLSYVMAYGVYRSRSTLSAIIDSITGLPIAIPGIAVGIGYFTMFHGLFRGIPFMSPLSNPVPYLILAYTVRRFTYMYRPLSAGLQKVGVNMEEQSLSLGANPFKTALSITLPLIMGQLIAGSMITSLYVSTEFSTSVILVGGYGVMASHPAPITPVIFNSLIYNPLLVHITSALIVLTLLTSTSFSLVLVFLLVTSLSGVRAKNLVYMLSGRAKTG